MPKKKSQIWCILFYNLDFIRINSQKYWHLSTEWRQIKHEKIGHFKLMMLWKSFEKQKSLAYPYITLYTLNSIKNLNHLKMNNISKNFKQLDPIKSNIFNYLWIILYIVYKLYMYCYSYNCSSVKNKKNINAITNNHFYLLSVIKKNILCCPV